MTNKKLTWMGMREEWTESILYLLTLISHMSQSEEEITPEEQNEDTDVSDEDAKE
jgi:hypothetical protein